MQTRVVGCLCLAVALTWTNGFAQQPGTLLWSLPLGADYSSPAIGAEGTLYLCSFSRLYSLTQRGTTNWSFAANDICYSSPAVGRDETIYFGSSDDHLYAVNPDGSKKWDFQAGDAIMSSPALAADGTIYFGSRDRKVYALNPNGTKKWEFVAGDIQRASPAVAADGAVYIGTMESKLLALRPDGTKKWEFNTDVDVNSSPAIAADGTIYFTTEWRILIALGPSGTELWRNTSQELASSPVIGKDGTIYVANLAKGGISAVNPTNGVILWSTFGAGTFRATNLSAPVAAENGFIYTGSWSIYWLNHFYAINPNGTTNWMIPSSAISGAPTIAPDGTVYYTTYSTLYALRGSAPLANSPWPKYRQNLRNTGKVEQPELRNPRLTANGFVCQVLGEIGQNYRIQASTDLLGWSVLTNCMSSNMPVPFADADATNYPSRFYRAVTP